MKMCNVMIGPALLVELPCSHSYASVFDTSVDDACIVSTAEAVLQEMDNISSIRQNREVERLRMWTDTEVVSLSINLYYSINKMHHGNMKVGCW
jgi:hypothetical protein